MNIIENNSELFYHIEDLFIIYHNNTRHFITGANPPYHRHDAYEIYFFLHGDVELGIEQSSYKLKTGDLAIVNPDELHRCIVKEGSNYDRIIMNIKEPLFEKLSSPDTNLLRCFENHPHGCSNLIHLNSIQQSEYIALSNKLIAINHSRQKYGSDLLSFAYITELIILINTLFTSNEPRNTDNLMPELIQNMMQYINDNLTSTISLDILSKQFNFNGIYLSSLFKQYTGLSLRTYILDQKIELAKKNLRLGCNVTEACRLAGFNDYSNFIRSFTKVTGISPGHYV